MKIDENGNPIKDKDGKTNIYYDPRTTEDSSPIDVYNTDLSKPVWTCECPPGYIKLPNDPYSCHRDPCYAGQGSSKAKYDPDKKECVCDDLTVKSNVTNFCYPLGLALEKCKPFSEPNQNNEKLCSCGFCGTFIGKDSKEYGLIVKYESNIYIAYPSQDKNYCSALLQIYPSNWLQSQDSNLYTTISSNQNKFADIKGSKLDDWFNIIGSIQIPDFIQKYPNVTPYNITSFINDTFTVVYSTVTDANQKLIEQLNTNEILKYGLIPTFCNSSFSNKSSVGLRCDNSDFLDGTLLNNDYNPTGVVCINYKNNDKCGQKSKFGTVKISPFDTRGYICECNPGYLERGNQCEKDCKARNDKCKDGSECCSGTCNIPDGAYSGGACD